MLWKFAPLFLGLVAAYLARNAAIHAALSQRRPFRALIIWLKASLVAIPAVALILGVGLLLRESPLFN